MTVNHNKIRRESLKYKEDEVLSELEKEIYELVDETSEIRYFGKKGRCILVDKDCPKYGHTRIRYRAGYVEVYVNQKIYHGNDRKLTQNDYKLRSLSRIILNLTNRTILAEHKNRNPLDNRRCNLRPCSQSQNMGNKVGHSKLSPYKGLSFKKDGRPVFVELQHSKKRRCVSLGFDTITKFGAVIYDCLAIEFYGEFAYTNLKKELYNDEIISFINEQFKEFMINKKDRKP